MYSKEFWKGAGERALKTFLQAFVAVLFVTGVPPVVTATQAVAMPWLTAVVSGAVAALFSLLTSIGNVGFVAGGAAKPADQPAQPPAA